MKKLSFITLIALGVLMPLTAVPQDDEPPKTCTLGNSKCERKTFPPNTETPGCSSAREQDCFGGCIKRGGTQSWESSYCYSAFGHSCKIYLTPTTFTGSKAECMSGMGKCQCNPDTYVDYSGTIDVYRCKG